MSELLREGRVESIRKDVLEFTSSSKIDQKILKQVININKAHIIMLIETDIIDVDDSKKILAALSNIDKGMHLNSDFEDVHVTLSTPRNRNTILQDIIIFIEEILQRFPLI